MKRLLSTKILSKEFKNRLLVHPFSLVEQSFIQISPIQNPELTDSNQAIIFSSQNAVKIALANSKIKSLVDQKPIYCIGKKTASLLAKNGQKVVEIALNSLELAQFIIKNHQNESFSFFCGKSRVYDLEDILSANEIPIQPVEIYETLPQPTIIKGYFDGLIFFSPSGVKGYAIHNGFEETHCFCLGSTTAEAVREFTPKLSIAKTPSESQLFLSITKHFNQ
jgi:uroporphyrinogen-III synthase